MSNILGPFWFLTLISMFDFYQNVCNEHWYYYYNEQVFIDAQNETFVYFYMDHALCCNGGKMNCCSPFASPTYKILRIK